MISRSKCQFSLTPTTTASVPAATAITTTPVTAPSATASSASPRPRSCVSFFRRFCICVTDFSESKLNFKKAFVTVLGFHTIPRETKDNRTQRLCWCPKKLITILLLRIHRNGRHDVRCKTAMNYLL